MSINQSIPPGLLFHSLWFGAGTVNPKWLQYWGTLLHPKNIIEVLMVNYHVQFNVLMFPAKSDADSKHDTAVTDTVNRGSGRKGKNEGRSAAAVCQHDSYKWYTEQEATVVCWRWKQEQSKSLRTLWSGCHQKFGSWSVLLCNFCISTYMGPVWDLVTVDMLVLECLRINHCLQFFASTWTLFGNCPLFSIYLLRDLTFIQPTFVYATACKEMHLEIHVICLGNNEIYCIFKTWLMHLCICIYLSIYLFMIFELADYNHWL